MGVRNQITLLILCHISSRLVTVLKVIDAPIQVSGILVLIVSFKFIKFSFYILFLFYCLLASRLALFRLCTLLWVASCNHCILASFFVLKIVNILHQTMIYAA